MKPTSTYYKTIDAYLKGFELISNRGSSRSGKTFAICQFLVRLCLESNKARKITIVSHTYDHLERGVVYDLDCILRDEGFILAPPLKKGNPYRYTLGNSMIECISLDKPDKALGGTRDILFINECNKIPFETYNQLETRTKECTFIDYNPSEKFWLDKEHLLDETNAIEIESTYLANIENLTQKQIDKFEAAKRKAAQEEAEGKKGYWWYWWQCYGLGKLSIMVDKLVFPKVKMVDKVPEHANFIAGGIDFSNSEGQDSDPHAVVKGYYADQSVYIKPIYKGVCQVVNTTDGKISTDFEHPNDLVSHCYNAQEPNIQGECPFVSDRANGGNIRTLRSFGIDSQPYEGQYLEKEGINTLNRFDCIYIVGDNWLYEEFRTFEWDVDKVTGEIIAGKPKPRQKDHGIAASRYMIQKIDY